APTGASLILDYLRLEGVDTIFGVPGGGLIALLAELRKRGKEFRFVIARQETGALFEADGYARVRGHVAAAMVTSGPGALNAVNGFVNANDSHVPVILFSGELSEALTGHGYIQEGLGADLDVPALYRATTAYAALCTDLQNLQVQLEHALRLAATAPYGATQVTIPNDVAVLPLASSVLNPIPASPDQYRPVAASAAPEAETRVILKNLLAAKKPLLFLGNGCRRSLLDPSRSRIGSRTATRLQRLLALCDRFAIPVVTTPDAKGIFPETHPLSLRFYGKASCPWPAAYMGNPQFDALLTLGASLHDLDTERWAPAMVPAGPFMQVDLDPGVIGRGFPISLGVVADVGPMIDLLYRLGEEAKLTKGQQAAMVRRRALVAKVRATSPFRFGEAMSSTTSPAKPQAIMKAITELAPEGCHILADPGNSLAWAAHYLAVDPPGYRSGKGAVIRGQSHQALGMGPMGWATAAVVGCKIGAPDSACVAITGDGAFLMHGNEVATAASHGVGAVWVVLDNQDLAMVSQGMFLLANHAGGPDPAGWEDYYDLGRHDLAGFAKSLGAQAVTVKSPEEFRDAFSRALQQADTGKKKPGAGTKFDLGGRPQVIVVQVDRAEIPPLYPPDFYPPGRE
ncbi:MAG TPA: thiamine pyrophosphate-binding protein, partial [Gemmatimonadales bacterium]